MKKIKTPFADQVTLEVTRQIETMNPESRTPRMKPRRVVRKAFICKYCEGVYADEPVTSCDCMEYLGKAGPHFIEGKIEYLAFAQP